MDIGANRLSASSLVVSICGRLVTQAAPHMTGTRLERVLGPTRSVLYFHKAEDDYYYMSSHL